MKLSEDLKWRGLIKDTTFADPTWLDTPRTFYLGVDCSSDSMTIGNLAVMLLARRLRAAGWNAVLLVGGATSLIGDPGGKDEERDLKSREEIQANVTGIKGQVERLFAGADFTLVDNYDWFKEVGYLDFLREVGKHYSMTELVQRDFIATRMGEGGGGISYAEFSYSLIQGYDYWQLYKQHDVQLQIGGSDQWGNMLSGVPLIRKREGAEVHALSIPLVIDPATGKKFGKSEGGAVWLDAAKTTPTAFYQFWMNCSDEGSEDYLKVYTDLDEHTVGDLIERHKQDPKARLAQRTLAQQVTALVHGEDAAIIAERVTGFLTGKAKLTEATQAELEALRLEIPSLEKAESVTRALVDTGLASSLTDARRFLQDGAISLDGERVNQDALTGMSGPHLLRRGKRFADSALLYW